MSSQLCEQNQFLNLRACIPAQNTYDVQVHILYIILGQDAVARRSWSLNIPICIYRFDPCGYLYHCSCFSYYNYYTRFRPRPRQSSLMTLVLCLPSSVILPYFPLFFFFPSQTRSLVCCTMHANPKSPILLHSSVKCALPYMSRLCISDPSS